MRFLLAGLTVLFLVVAVVTDSPGLLGLSLVGAAICSFAAIIAFAQSRIDSRQQRQIYLPSPDERELMRKAMEKRKLDAAANRTTNNDDEREQA